MSTQSVVREYLGSLLLPRGISGESMHFTVCADLNDKGTISGVIYTMGLGQRATAISIAISLGVQRVFVVCPASCRISWQQTILGSVKDPDFELHCVSNVRTGGLPKKDRFIILSYEHMRRITKPMAVNADLFIVQAARDANIWDHVLRVKDAETRLLALVY